MEFKAFPKLPRLNRGMIITEKLDGTNACIVITNEVENDPYGESDKDRTATVMADGTVFAIYAQSRKRIITPGKSTDNCGFAGWVKDNAADLVTLGQGHHYGEWWGQGIQRGYDQDGKRFSLFNTGRWSDEACAAHGPRPECCDVVPVLATGNFSQEQIDTSLFLLGEYGSEAAPGFMDPEGVVIYLSSARQSFKATLKDDHIPKGLLATEDVIEAGRAIVNGEVTEAMSGLAA